MEGNINLKKDDDTSSTQSKKKLTYTYIHETQSQQTNTRIKIEKLKEYIIIDLIQIPVFIFEFYKNRCFFPIGFFFFQTIQESCI